MILHWRSFFFLSLLSLAGSLSAHEHVPAAPVAKRHDMSKMWAEMISRNAGSGVSLAADEAGGLWLIRMHSGHVWVSRSDDGGQRFSSEVKVNPVAEAILAEGQNRPKIAVRRGVVVVSWAQALPKVFAGHIRFSRSTDGGQSFSAPVTLNDNREEIGHGFSALSISDKGQVAVIWLDGRERSAAVRAGKKYIGSAVYYAISDDGGARFAANVKLADNSCECCRIAIAVDVDGIPVAQWRHVFGANVRDFAIARLETGAKIVRASEDGWEIDACPHHGGDIAIDEKGRRHLVWFTGSQKSPGLFYRYADAQGMSVPIPFGDLDAQAGNPAVFSGSGRVFLAWREFDGKAYRLMMRRSDDAGINWGAPRVIASTAGAADLPLFVSGAKTPLLGWSSLDEGVRVFDLGNER